MGTLQGCFDRWWPPRRLLTCWSTAALVCPGHAGLTAFTSNPADDGIAQFHQDVYIQEQFLEPDDGRCDSLSGPQCASLHGNPSGAAPGGIFSLFASLPGDPGFFVQDEVGPYFISAEGWQYATQELLREHAEASAMDAETVPASTSPSVAQSVTSYGSGTLPGRCVRIGFNVFPPHVTRLPRLINITTDLTLEVHGEFALTASASSANTFAANSVGGQAIGRAPRVFAEVQEPITYLRFSTPVVVEQIWVAKHVKEPVLSSTGARTLEQPVVLRGRRGSDEHWSVYFLDWDFQKGWVTPTRLAPLPVDEIVVLGGQGLRIASLYVSQTAHTSRSTGSHMSANRYLGRAGWLFSPSEGMRSLYDLQISKLPLPSSAAVFSLEEVHRLRPLRLRADLIDEEALRAGGHLNSELDEQVLDGNAAPNHVSRFPSQASEYETARAFVDARTVDGLRALLNSLQAGALPFPVDVPLDVLEADMRHYGDVFTQVTIEEAANARGLDELYERLFTANHMDALDLLFLGFLWANHTGSLRAPSVKFHEGSAEGTETETTNPASAALGDEEFGDSTSTGPSSMLNAPDANGKRRRSILANLRRYTAQYVHWRKPIERKVAFLNSSAGLDVTFGLFENNSWLSVDYYNPGSGRGGHVDIEVPDAEYLLAEMLGVEGELLLDHRGRPLSEAKAQHAHAERTYLDDFGMILMELRELSTETPVELPPPIKQDVDLDDEPQEVREVSTNTPPLSLAIGVLCLVIVAVFAIAWAPLRAPRRAPPV